jgi:hypothetical protein
MAGIAGTRDLLKTLCKNVILNALNILFWEFVVFDAYVFPALGPNFAIHPVLYECSCTKIENR